MIKKLLYWYVLLSLVLYRLYIGDTNFLESLNGLNAFLNPLDLPMYSSTNLHYYWYGQKALGLVCLTLLLWQVKKHKK